MLETMLTNCPTPPTVLVEQVVPKLVNETEDIHGITP
jgi:hypothetical protein